MPLELDETLAGWIGTHIVEPTSIKLTDASRELEVLRGIIDGARDQLEQFRQERSRVLSLEQLSDVGKRHQIQEAAGRIVEEITLSATQIDDGEQLFEKLKGQLAQKTFEGADDSAATAIREAEVRKQLLDLSDENRTIVFLRAVEHQEELVVRAVFNAPEFIQSQLVDRGMYDQGIETWQELRSPETSSAVAALGDAVKKARTAVRASISEIRQLSGLTPDRVVA